MPKRTIATARLVLNVLHSILFVIFLGLVAMVLAAYLGAGGLGIIGAGLLGLIAGVAASQRIWFEPDTPLGGEIPPGREEAAPAAWRLPGIPDQFARLRARQRALASLLISALLILVALRFVPTPNWPSPFGVPREHLLLGALLLVVIVMPLGLLNWRCPNCRRNLGRTLSIKQCPHCGVVLQD